MTIEQKKKKQTAWRAFSIVTHVLSLNQEHIPRVSKVWVNQPKVQGLAEGKLTVLSGIHP